MRLSGTLEVYKLCCIICPRGTNVSSMLVLMVSTNLICRWLALVSGSKLRKLLVVLHFLKTFLLAADLLTQLAHISYESVLFAASLAVKSVSNFVTQIQRIV